MLAIVVLLFLILVLLLSIPAVQTSLGKYATKRLNDKFGTNINIARLGLQFNGDIELKEIYIEDYKLDTLISINELNTSVLSFKKLYENKFTFGDIDLEGLYLNLKTYRGEANTNLDVFVSKLDDNQPRTEPSTFLLSSSDVTISDSKFKITDENKTDGLPVEFKELNINGTDFVIFGPDVKVRINKLSFLNRNGLKVENMSTNFAYSLTDMTFENLKIQTPASELNGQLQFTYDREDLQHFIDSVGVSAAFKESRINLDELNLFYNEFGKDHDILINTNLAGTMNNLYATGLLVRAPGRTLINGDITFKNLFNNEDDNFEMIAEFRELSSTYYDLRRLLPNVLGNSLPSTLDKFGKFIIQGRSTITSKTIVADLDISTALGIIYSDLKMEQIDEIDVAKYKGNLVMDEFNLGRMVDDPEIGSVSLNLDVDGRGFTLDALNSFVEGTIYGLNYNDYYYSNIDIKGDIKNKVFNGFLKTKDANIDLDFDGLVDFSKSDNNYDFVADVHYADLNRLNFVERDSISVFKGVVDMKMRGKNIDDIYGKISFFNTSYTNQDDVYFFKDFEVTSRFDENIRFITINSPDIIQGELSGQFVIRDIGKLFENSLGNIYTNYKPFAISDNQFINFNFSIYNKIAEVFYPKLKLGSNTYIRGRVESNANKFKLTFRSPEISFDENFAKDIALQVDNDNPFFNTLVEIDSLHSNFYKVSDLSLVNVTKNDTLFVKSEFTGGKRNDDAFDLSLFYTINENNKSVIGIRQSEVQFKGNSWFINDDGTHLNNIVFDRGLKNISLNDLSMKHQNEEIFLKGLISNSGKTDIDLDFRDVELTKVSPTVENLTLEGIVNGSLNIKQQDDIYIPESNVMIENFKMNEINLGSFRANIVGNASLTNYAVDIQLKEDNEESLRVKGNLDVAGKNASIDVNVAFNRFLLEPLNPFGDGNITNIRGEVSGNARIGGQLSRPNISGQLSLVDAGMTIPYLNVDYELEDETQVTLRDQSFIFQNAQLTDSEYFSRSILNGKVSHVNLSNWSLGLDINSDRLLVLNTGDSEDALYYGTAFVNGNINIIGPTEQLIIRAEVSSEEGTVFKIPLNDTEAFGYSSYIHFLSPEEKEARLKGEVTLLNEIKGLEMDFDLTVNENAEIEIVIDRDSGSTIKGRGNGGLLAQINTNGKFNMYGDFIVTEGVYNFIYGGLIEKEFDVLPGGTLVWEGDPLQAQINIRAVYDKIQANPTILLDNPINRSIPVEVEIHLTGELEKPDPTFNLRFPNVNTTLNSELQYRLDDDESRQFQALSLLATGSFRNELSFGAQDAIGLVSDRAAALLNSLISSSDGKLDVGFDFQLSDNNPNYESDSRVGVTLSTQLSDRILVNGKVGVPVGGVNETVVAGDIEIEVLLNEDRTLTLKVFNRENSIRNFGEQIGYTQGVGLSYNVEFDNLKELFEKIFRGNKKKALLKEKDKNNEKNGLPEFMNFKSTDTTSQKPRVSGNN
ncbi:MAG: translocation/assembly module TamB [Flavobacteriaceae bacterium]|nr:translocation/assembly module TamB [Bacteroidia bacterium]NNF76341.1 translocation/assembly module TamB [Flavobacteriaceae bacterium]